MTYGYAVQLSRTYRHGADPAMTPPGLEYRFFKNDANSLRVQGPQGQAAACFFFDDKIPESSNITTNDQYITDPEEFTHVRKWEFTYGPDEENEDEATYAGLGIAFNLYRYAQEGYRFNITLYCTTNSGFPGQPPASVEVITLVINARGPRIYIIDGVKHGIDTSFGVLDKLYAAPFAERTYPFNDHADRATLEDGDRYIDVEGAHSEDMIIEGTSRKMRELVMGILLLGFCQVRKPQPAMPVVSVGAAFSDI